MAQKEIEKEIIICLESELRFYNKIAVLCLKLKDAILNETDFSLINNIISEKIKVRDEIEKVSLLRRELNGQSVNSDEAILQLTGKLRWVINKIIEYEKECESKLSVLYTNIGERLSQVNNGFQMIKSFPKGYRQPSYISIKV